ncbi:hypothetical protein CNR22_08010 [Sphingobacteriaceae bacterium]|nr:hypothetical protein CNR22_08010 [Sphingobacteriaceae bacterium]
MNSLNKVILLVVLSFIFLSFLQKEETKPLVIITKFDFFTTDNIGNIYTVKEDELIKYLPSGKFFARYSNLKLGSITSVDATNPLKIILYYRDFQQMIFLDNQLSVNSEIVSLEKLGYEQTDLVCASNNNSFWIYNKQNNELHRFDENSKRITSTGNLKQVLQTDLNPNYMMEHNGYLYLNSPGTGVYVFDIFGAFSKIISIKNLPQFQVSEDIIYFQRDSSFCSYNYTLFEEACKTLPNLGKARSVKYSNKKLYSAFKDSLLVQEF